MHPKTTRPDGSQRQESKVAGSIRHPWPLELAMTPKRRRREDRIALSLRLMEREPPVNDFERAELRALASLLEDWPTSDKTALGYANDVVALVDSKSGELQNLRAHAGDGVKEWLSVEGTGRLLGIGGHTVYGVINRGELVAYRIGRVYRIRLGDVATFLETARVKPGDLHHLVVGLPAAG